MVPRVFAWWSFAEAAIGRLAHPRVDAGAADADVQAVVTGSALFAVGRAAFLATERAWIHSRVSRLVEGAQRRVPAGSLADRIRLTAWCAAVAAATASVLQLAGTTDAVGFRMIVPLGAGLVAVIAARAADPIARAWQDKRS
jgi:hypothetical protein